jgi:RND superfamily putative drug exporter
MTRAIRRVGPAILASGLTVSLSMLVLLVADTKSLSSFGPVAAIGVACVLAAGLTLLPALLTIGGRRGFWPRSGVVAYRPEAREEVPRGWWRRFGDRVLQRPGPALAVTVAIFGIGALGLLAYQEDYSITNVFKKPTESIDGFHAIEEAFPAGATNPTTVLVERFDERVRSSDVDSVARRLTQIPGVASVTNSGEVSRDGRIGRLTLIFNDDPYTAHALDRIPKLREQVDDVGPDLRALIGGGTAVQYDFDKATGSDFRKIVPLALVVIAVILALLLQALVAPLVLILTVMASFFGTVGLSIVFIRYVVGDPGVDASLPVFAFIFLVALGIDYTIFLMSRVREEARRHGTREGVLRALSVTGPVITSAGIILAGTFSVLMTLPVTFAFNIGFMVAVGILLDTFIVRTIMVPAAVEVLGDRIWWPSGPGGGRRVLSDEAGAEPGAEPATP